MSTNLFENLPNSFGGEDFLSFHYSHIRQNSPAPWRPCFLTNHFGLKESDSHPRNISEKLFENRPDTFRGEVFLSFHYIHIRQNSTAPWRPCFSSNQLDLKESVRGSPKEHFCFGHFRRRRFLSLHYFLHDSKQFEGIQERTLRGCFLWSFKNTVFIMIIHFAFADIFTGLSKYKI